MKQLLTPKGMVVYSVDNHTTIRFNELETRKLYGVKDMPRDYPAPEVVHLEISAECNLKCPYCYVGHKKRATLSTEKWLLTIRQLAQAGVFQLTFGGGEPTMHPDLGLLARAVKAQGLNLTMTTNGTLLDQTSPDILRLFDQINVSFHQDTPNPVQRMLHGLEVLQSLEIPRGINYSLSRSNVNWAAPVALAAQATKASLLLMTYKPVIGDKGNQIPPQEVFKMGKILGLHYKINVAVDGLTCNQCLVNQRFCDIDCEGNVLPCSFQRKTLGNVSDRGFKDIWTNREYKGGLICDYTLDAKETVNVPV